jgi:hypothetical protein
METDYHDFSWPSMPKELREKLDIGDMYINAIICSECNYFTRSKNRHHNAVCKCGSCRVDGGSWYIRITASVPYENIIVHFENL